MNTDTHTSNCQKVNCPEHPETNIRLAKAIFGSASVSTNTREPRNETRGTCECSDPHCPFCAGHCRNWSNIVLNRCDMEDKTGVAFCEDCAEDAMDSGVFTNMDDFEDETSD